MSDILLGSSCALMALALAAGASAQVSDDRDLDDNSNTAVIQPIREPAGAAELRAAMRRISYNPSDADALADAGNAALTLGDSNAALNFFTRANSIRPNNGRIVSGLASATVRTENPFEALRLFDDAIKLGVSERSIATDRALAFDLLGNFSRAQQDYNLARTASISDDLVIRQAVSLSLAGERAQSDGMLVPLLQKNSAAAWRARAFMLAERGEFRESTKVAQGFLDAASAQRMERYFRLLPDLTAAQKAAAIHLGHFPASQYVGRDSERVRTLASTIPAVQPAQNASRLIPAGEPLGSKAANADRKSDRRRDRKNQDLAEAKVATAATQNATRIPKIDTKRQNVPKLDAAIVDSQPILIADVGKSAPLPSQTTRPLVQEELPRQRIAINVPPATMSSQSPSVNVAASTPRISAPTPAVQSSATVATTASVSATGSANVGLATISAPQVTPTAATNAKPTDASPGFVTPIGVGSVQVVQNARTQPAVTNNTATQSSQTAAMSSRFDLGAIVSSIQIPESEQKPSAVPVDLKAIKPAVAKSVVTADKPKTVKLDPKVAAKAKIEAANPARFWVQVATGEEGALGFDYRRFAKKSPELFKKFNGWTSEWGRTSRLLVGPFSDIKTAKKWEVDYKKAGGDSFMWQSEKGIVVTPLKSK